MVGLNGRPAGTKRAFRAGFPISSSSSSGPQPFRGLLSLLAVLRASDSAAGRQATEACSPAPVLRLAFLPHSPRLAPSAPGSPAARPTPPRRRALRPASSRSCLVGWAADGRGRRGAAASPPRPAPLPSARCHLNSPSTPGRRPSEPSRRARAAGGGPGRPSRAARRRPAVQSRARRQQSHWLGAVTPRGAAAAASADWRAGGYPAGRARAGACRTGCSEAHRRRAGLPRPVMTTPPLSLSC